MNFYESAFLILTVLCGLFTWRQYQDGDISPEKRPLLQGAITAEAKAEANQFRWRFLTVYVLIMGADWLQGPFIYSLYKDQFSLPEKTVAALFTTGFLSGGISAYAVGQFADRYGRKTACLLFCILYLLSCFSTLLPKLPILFFGRVLGGISTSLMYSAFESWTVTEYHLRQMDKKSISLSSIFGIMTTLNSIAAILAGVCSEWLVHLTDSKRAPFMASAGLLTVAFFIISYTWTENYGSTHTHSTQEVNTPPVPSSTESEARRKSALATILTSPKILTLILATTIFDTSMYLFVFFWVPALTTSHHSSAPLPLGLIFASFMASVMLGSLIFNLLVSKHQLLTHSRLLVLVLLVAASSLLISVVLAKNEKATFLTFLAFELNVGLYWPTTAYLKGRLIDDGVRARVYAVMRVPLNLLVCLALLSMKEGGEYRKMVFEVCGGCLGVGAVMVGWLLL